MNIGKFKIGGFYYSLLDVDDQTDYRNIAEAVVQHDSAVVLSGTQELERLAKVCSALRYDNPELSLYWNSTELSLSDDGLLKLVYTKDEKEARLVVKKVREIRREIMEKVMEEEEGDSPEEAAVGENEDEETGRAEEAGKSSEAEECSGTNKNTEADPAEMMDGETAKVIRKTYSYLLHHVKYAADELKKPQPRPWIYNIEGAFLYGKAGCVGIALAMSYICEALGIPCLLVTGRAKFANKGTNLCWNMVTLEDGQNYHIDVTSQLVNKEDEEAYLLLKDEEMKELGFEWGDIYPEA